MASSCTEPATGALCSQAITTRAMIAQTTIPTTTPIVRQMLRHRLVMELDPTFLCMPGVIRTVCVFDLGATDTFAGFTGQFS
jgi:hypothetical protein